MDAMQTTKELLDAQIRDIFTRMQDANMAKDIRDYSAALQSLVACQPLIGEMDSEMQSQVTAALASLIEKAAPSPAPLQDADNTTNENKDND